jgi:CheY-like chemotaxis protein
MPPGPVSATLGDCMDARRPRILIVDDLEDHRELLSQVLVDFGYAVTSAGDGQAALDSIEDGIRPDLVLLDLWMPVMDGAELLSRLRAHEDREVARIPVVLMTADPVAAPERTGGALPDLTLAKPFGLKELRQVVLRFCGPGAGIARSPEPSAQGRA